jgi:chemotaxis protein CheC
LATEYTDLQLDALRELANIGSGNAGTALAGFVGRPVDISVPNARVLDVADAVDAAGPADRPVTAVVLPIFGDMDAIVLLVFGEEDAALACRLLGVEPGSEYASSAVGEIGNILGASYVTALGSMTGLALEPAPPTVVEDMLGAIVSSVVVAGAADSDVALVLDSSLSVEGEACELGFVLIPSKGGVDELLSRLGL